LTINRANQLPILEAAGITAAYASNRGYLWASLRAALADYPVLPLRCRTGSTIPYPSARPRSTCARAPSSGPVSGSVAITEAELEAARKGRTVVRKGRLPGRRR
jgi:hypothetical protein